MLNDASPAARRGRTFGVVSAISNLGTVVGALASSAVWQAISLGAGLLLPSLSILCAGLTLLALPRSALRPPVRAPSPAPVAPPMP